MICFSKQWFWWLTLTLATASFGVWGLWHPQDAMEGLFEIQIEKITKEPRGYSYRARIVRYQPDGADWHNAHLECKIYSRERKNADFTYLIEGKLSVWHKVHYSLKTSKEWRMGTQAFMRSSLWANFWPKKWPTHFVNWRFDTKKKIHSFLKITLQPVLGSTQVISLFATLITGEGNDPFLAKLFENAGLSHLLAISGFHFALLALLLHVILRLFLPPRLESLALAALLSAYYLLLGPSASVQRAWIAAMIWLISRLIGRPASGLNSLGVGLIIAFLLDPMSTTHLGFQLSFLATGALFIVAPAFLKALRGLIPEIYEDEKHAIRRWMLKTVRQTLALNLSVHAVLLPLLLHSFHRFDVQSLFYNLIFPTLFAPMLFGVSLALLLQGLLPATGIGLLKLTAYYTQGILSLLSWRPFPHKSIYCGDFSIWISALWITSLFVMGQMVVYRQSLKE